MKREHDPINPQNPKPENIKCKDCKNRDKAYIDIKGKRIYVGITKCFCIAYPDGKGKPYDVLFQNADCKYYEKEA